MNLRGTFDPQSGLLENHVQEMIQKRIKLRNELKELERELEKHVFTLKHFMAIQGYKKIELQGLHFSYSYPRIYLKLNRPKKELAMKYPELFDRISGYERLTISLASQTSEKIRSIEQYDLDVQRAGLKLKFQGIRASEGENAQSEEEAADDYHQDTSKNNNSKEFQYYEGNDWDRVDHKEIDYGDDY